MSIDKLIAETKALLGEANVITETSSMAHYTMSMRHRHVRSSPMVALPHTAQQVADVVNLCRKFRVPYVPQGGNTGLVDGGLPNVSGEEIIISLSRMNKVCEIDTFGLIATVEAGITLLHLRETAAAEGLMFPLWIASEGSAEVGGLIATNAGGLSAMRYGCMRNLVLGVEAVLPSGKIISCLKALVKDNTGYHLASTFLGAEGTLGIVTAATLRLLPALRQKFTAMAAVRDFDAALKLLSAFQRGAAENLIAFEFMSLEALQLLVKHVHGARFPANRQDAPYYLLIELGASSEIVPLQDMFEAIIAPTMGDGDVLDAVVAESETQAKQFWHAREHIPEALRAEKQRVHFDIALPIQSLGDFLGETSAKVRAFCSDAVLMPFGHIGDGNVHYNMYIPAAMNPEAWQAVKKQLQDIVFGEVKRWNGSISAEHGVGVERKEILAKVKSPVELDVMRSIKRALDPDHLCNPGKIFD